MATAQQIRNAISAAKGRVFTIVAATLPTTEATLRRRHKVAEANSVEGVAFAASQTLATQQTDAGTISVVRVSGRPDPAWGGGDPIRTNKKGGESLGFLVSAMNEYGVGGTACPNTGRVGTACVNRKARHSHRAYGLDRISSVVVAGVEFVV